MALHVCSNDLRKPGADSEICSAFASVVGLANSDTASSADSDTLCANLIPVSRALRTALTGATKSAILSSKAGGVAGCRTRNSGVFGWLKGLVLAVDQCWKEKERESRKQKKWKVRR
jgi:hypothetical protein